MSQAATQLPDVNELDARVDALMADIAQTTSNIAGASPEMVGRASGVHRANVVEAVPASEPADEAPELSNAEREARDAEGPGLGLEDADFLDFDMASKALGIDMPAAQAVNGAVERDPMADVAADLAAVNVGTGVDATIERARDDEPAAPAGPSIDDVLADAAAELAASLDAASAEPVAASSPGESAVMEIASSSGRNAITISEDDFASPEAMMAPSLAEAPSSDGANAHTKVSPTGAIPASKTIAETPALNTSAAVQPVPAPAVAASVPSAPAAAAATPTTAATPARAEPTAAMPSVQTSDAGKLADLEHRANQPPIADIEALDKALAANAERSVAEAAAKPAEPVAPAAPASSDVVKSGAGASVGQANATANAASTGAPATSPANAQVAQVAPLVKPEPEVVEPEPVVERVPLSVRLGVITRPMTSMCVKLVAPIAQVHMKLPEGTRQTIGFLALMQIFAAAVVWGWVLTPKLQKDVEVDTAGIYENDAEAHEAAEKAHASGAAGHGAKGEHAGADTHAKSGGHGEAKTGGHGAEAKSDAHGKKDDKKKADEHGKKDEKKADAHAKPAEKKTASKSSSKKADAKKDAHGGH